MDYSMQKKDKLINEKITHNQIFLILFFISLIITFNLFRITNSVEDGSKEKVYTFNTVTKVSDKGTEQYIKLEDIVKYKEFNKMIFDTISINNVEYVHAPTMENIAKKTIEILKVDKQKQATAISEISSDNNIIEIYKVMYKYSEITRFASFYFGIIFAMITLIMFSLVTEA